MAKSVPTTAATTAVAANTEGATTEVPTKKLPAVKASGPTDPRQKIIMDIRPEVEEAWVARGHTADQDFIDDLDDVVSDLYEDKGGRYFAGLKKGIERTQIIAEVLDELD